MQTIPWNLIKKFLADHQRFMQWLARAGTYKLPSEEEEPLSPAWKDTEYVRVSYAIGALDTEVHVYALPCSFMA
jgi:hypothetical protein